MHANGQPAPDIERAQQLYRDLDEVIALLGTPLYTEPEQTRPPQPAHWNGKHAREDRQDQ